MFPNYSISKKPVLHHALFVYLFMLFLLFFLGFKHSIGFAHGKKAHVHGVADLEFSIDENGVEAHVDAPLDSLLGFERAPRTDAEKAAANRAIAVLEKGEWIELPAAAQCNLFGSDLSADVLKETAQAKGGHADASLHIRWRCAKPELIKELSLKWFEQFKHTDTLNVQVVGLQGQTGKKIKRGQAANVQMK